MGIAKGSKDADFFGLVQQISTDAGAEREEAESHCDEHDSVEDRVEDQLDLRECLLLIVVVVDANVPGL